MRLKDRVAIVTGAAQGIGAVYVRVLATEGAKTVIVDVKNCTKTEETIRAELPNAEVMSHLCDVSDEASVQNLIDTIKIKYGRVDILVNNAAVFASLDRKPFDEISVDEWDQVMSVNLRGVFLCTRAAYPVMKAQKYGKIINIASDTMMKGTTHFAHYVASKGGVVAFSRAIAKEVGKEGICVNSIAPGLTCTDVMEAEEGFTPARFNRSVSARAIPRIQTPEDLAGTVIYLASSDSDFVTGQCIVVNGGDNLY
ncbi:SDR family oxidoreductase [Alphaproteobacteria bacterium]|nr:SDR family oxidoreductase [Alphaproteobacteria bacterium]